LELVADRVASINLRGRVDGSIRGSRTGKRERNGLIVNNTRHVSIYIVFDTVVTTCVFTPSLRSRSLFVCALPIGYGPRKPIET
jgi:hypothetical protein